MGFLTIKKHFLLYYFKLTGVMNVGLLKFLNHKKVVTNHPPPPMKKTKKEYFNKKT
jgi:hypothetical protein